MIDAGRSDTPPPGFSPGRFCRFATKELRETLRDRRTILTLVLMPLFVYPLLGLTFQRFLLSQSSLLGGVQRPEYQIGFGSKQDAQAVEPFLTVGDRPTANDDPTGDPVFRARYPEDRETDVAILVERGLVDLGVRVDRGEIRGNGTVVPASVELVYDPASPTAAAARREIEGRLRSENEAFLRDRLRRARLSESPLVEITVRPVRTDAGPAQTIAAILPLVLVLMTVTGAVYPAIDLTAGERERGTLEALVAAPVSRRAVLAAKYVAVFTVAVLTAGMNLIAMSATAFSLGLDKVLFAGGLTSEAVSQTVALVLVLAAFFSAVLLLVTSFARSFKEAQAYLIPVILVSLAPGIVALMPDLPLTLPLAVTPLMGVVLLGRDLLTGGADGLLITACFGATLLYASLALLLAARVFGTDAVLFGSTGTWSELFHRPEESRSVPPVTVGAACLAALLPAFLLLGPIPGRLEELSVAGKLAVNAVLSVVLFLVLPSAAAMLSRADFHSTFRLRMPGFLGVIGATLLALSLWPFAHEIELLVFSRERVEVLRKFAQPIIFQLGTLPLWSQWAALAVVPAASEEWFFRGFLLSSLRSRLNTWQAIVATGLTFGAFHVVVRDGLLFERFVPTALMGLILGGICVRTGSLWPGMLLHVVHNGLLLTLAAYQKELTAWGWSGGERSHLPWPWLATAAVTAAIGTGCVLLTRKAGAPDEKA